MALLTLKNLTLSRGSTSLFKYIELSINAGDRIGLVGHNGSGKSSLLSVLAAREEADSGELQIPRGLQIALVEQFVPASILEQSVRDSLLTVISEELRSTEQYRADKLLGQLGFPVQVWPQPFRQLSGGEQNLLLLARAMLSEPELLLMDEPGNHMDIVALSRLQYFLNETCKLPYLLVSHDRSLLNACCNRTCFLRDCQLHTFDLPYEAAQAELEARDEQAVHRHAAQEKEIKRIEASAKRLARWGRDFDNEDLARKAKTMHKRVDRLKDAQTTVSRGSRLDLQLQTENLKSNTVLTLENMQLNTPDGGRHLLSCDFQYIKPGDRIALIGRNGVGKSCLLNLLRGAYENPVSGIRFNPGAGLGFYDQKLELFQGEQDRFDWLCDRCDVEDNSIRQALLQAGIPYEKFNQPVRQLSGGERARMMFVYLKLIRPNFLILDEPTNHIDIEGREQLEIQLTESDATLLITSHDRLFVDNIANRWWWIDHQQLHEVPDAESFYTSLSVGQSSDTQTSPGSSGAGVLQDNATDSVDSEESVLQRIVELEALISADKNRKARFQKPLKQQQWSEELKVLWEKIES